MRHRLEMSQRQQLIMTPRLQQALKILQMPMLELQQMLKQEVLLNPLLEEVDEILENEEIKEVREEQLSPDEEEKEDRDPDWAEFLGDDVAESPTYPRSREETEYFEKVPTTRISFHEHLLGQLRLATTLDEDLEIGEYLIGSLDDRGFLVGSLDEIAEATGKSVIDLERVLALIQMFEPAGVGARDHRECLMIQLSAREEDDTLAYQIVRDHYDEMLRNRHQEIAKKLGVTDADVQTAKDHLGMLSLSPGSEIAGEEAKYVYPDLIVERIGGKYEVYLNDRNVPRLRISPAYESVLRGREKGGGDRTREYIEGKLNSARWLIQTIEQRRKTMVKVMKCIVEVQKDFFDKGISHLKPLTLSQIAERIGMHESTVSRVTRGKYVQTTRGVFELKYFFSSAIGREDGEDLSAKTVKDIITQLVQEETKSNPLSDQKIADILGDRGVKIARRTVAKYREQLGLPTARYRRRY